jgi:hypothetical protein
VPALRHWLPWETTARAGGARALLLASTLLLSSCRLHRDGVSELFEVFDLIEKIGQETETAYERASHVLDSVQVGPFPFEQVRDLDTPDTVPSSRPTCGVR